MNIAPTIATVSPLKSKFSKHENRIPYKNL